MGLRRDVGNYDGIKHDVAFRKDVANRVGVGFEIPSTLVSIEPIEPKVDEFLKEEVAVSA